jgi:hypothetical protein
MVKSQKIHRQSAASDKKPPATGPKTGARSMAKLKTLITLKQWISGFEHEIIETSPSPMYLQSSLI